MKGLSMTHESAGSRFLGRFRSEDKLKAFMKESEERLLDLKRNTEAKRGGGKKRK